MKLWFTADLHFSHKKMMVHRGLASPDDLSVEAMDLANRLMINAWNVRVRPEDTVYILGDVSFAGPTKTAQIVSQLQGNKFLIRGNHDSDKHIKAMEPYLERVTDYLMIKYQEQLIALCHYPMAVWDRGHYGAWHLHGHSHGQLVAPITTRLDVGWDVFGRPVSFEEVQTIMSSRIYRVVDQHGV